jgi:cell division protein ZapA (FtsZ GTPase activity inhibitor)
MSEMQRVEVEILGQKYTIRSEADPKYVRDLAAYVEKRVKSVEGQVRGQDPVKALALAGLYIADELFRAREELSTFVMSGGSFNLDTHEDAAQEGGAHAPHTRGSLKPSILAPTWLARFETPSAHGRGGAPPSLTFLPRRAYTFSDFRRSATPERSDRSGVSPPVWR